ESKWCSIGLAEAWSFVHSPKHSDIFRTDGKTQRDIKHLRWNTILGIKCSFRLSRPLSDRSARYNRGFFIKHKRKLTTLPILRYSSGHRKGRLKILSMNTADGIRECRHRRERGPSGLCQGLRCWTRRG